MSKEKTPSPPSRSGSAKRPSRGVNAKDWPISSRDRGLSEGFTQAVCSYLTRVAVTFLFEMRAYHAHRIPEKGAAILASNHTSFLDPILVGDCTTRRGCYLARHDLFEIPVLGSVIRRLGTMPVVRDSHAPKQSMEMCLKALKKGRLLLLFPEGTRSRDGSLQELKKGILLIVRRSGAPVIPVRVVGSFEAWPRNKLFPRRFPVRILFGKPLRYDDKKESADAFLGRLRDAIENLGREELATEDFGVTWPRRHPGRERESITSHFETGLAEDVSA